MGSVRQLTNTAGAVTNTYEYDAFGNQITHTGTTPNNYLYQGEEWDSDPGLYYLRARYMNPLTGRFVSMDPENGIVTDPKTLHKYIYADGDPVNLKDPTGRYTNTGTMGGGEGEYAGVTSFVIQAVEAAAPVIVVAETCVLLYEATKTLAEVSGGPFAQIVPGTMPCTVKAKKNSNCSAQDVETCQNLYPNCKGSQCGSCLSYCLTQCEWPFHKPEWNKWKFPKDWKDFPPSPIWIN